jgi:hypothetical protein
VPIATSATDHLPPRCSLSNNQIGDAGAKSLADALKSNTTLTELR